MTNSTATILANASLVAKASAKEFHDNLKFCNTIGKADESEFKGVNGFSAGQTISINKPFVPEVGNSFDHSGGAQAFVETKTSLTLDITKSVMVSLDSQELAYDIDMKAVYNRVVSPTIKAMASAVEKEMVNRAVLATAQGALITDVTAAATLAAKTSLGKRLAPMDGERYILGDNDFTASAITQRNTLFNASSEISKQYKEGTMGRADGFTWMENELLPTLAIGNDVTGAAIDGAVTTGSSTIHIDGITTGSGTVTAGTIFTIAGVYDVHPETKVTRSNLKQFVVITGGTASGVSDLDIVISPTIYGPTSDGLQNVSALPADDAAIVFVGAASTSYVNSLAYHKDAFRMASVPLILPQRAEFAVQETYKGITVRIVRDWDQAYGNMSTRVDFLGGFTAPNAEWSYRWMRA